MGKADLHIHTRHSDGLATVAAVLDHVEHHTDLDLIAITDHEDAAGGQEALELAARRGYRFEVVVGAEVTTLQGHLLALFIERAPPSFRSIEATLEAIHAQGGIAIVPHPLSWLTRSISRRTLDRLCPAKDPAIAFDAIETANPSLAGRTTAARAAGQNRRWRLPVTGGSDAHHLAHVGAAWTEFPGTTGDELANAIRTDTTRAVSRGYPPLREVGLGSLALGLARGYCSTPGKMVRSGVRWATARGSP